MPRFRILSAIVLTCISFLINPASAQFARQFSLSYSKNTRGGVTTIGNTVMHAVNTQGGVDLLAMNETSDPNNTSGGLGFSVYGNDQSDMRQLDIDGVASTRNSSSANLTLPSGSNTILFARLYWGARIDSSAYSQSLDTLKKILLRKGTSGAYTQFIAQDIDTINATDRSNLVYQAYVDITGFIQLNGSGTYTAADIPLSELDQTGGQYGGWAITVAYENQGLPYYSIRIYDGFAQVYNAGNAGTLGITLSGLNVPGTPLAADDAIMGSVAWEGDASLTGDYININNITVSNALNPSNNFFNGSITKNAVFITSKNPNYSNQMGIDIDELNVGTGYNINANATSVNILFGTTQDMYFPGVFTFVMKTKEPTVKITKTVTDANGNGLVDNNELLTYTLTGNNLGPDSSYNTYIIDTIPSNVTYIPGSLEVVNATGVSAGIKTDAPGDDQAFVSAAGGRTFVRFNIGFGASATDGGILPVLTGSEYLLRFKVRAAANASTVTNLGRVYGQAVNGAPFVDESIATIYLNTTLGLGQSDTACNSYTWNGNTYTQSGTYTYNYINSSGNPVTDTLYLTINYSVTTDTTVTLCANALPYSWNGQSYNAAGTYSANLISTAGCDSIARLTLILKNSTSAVLTVSACDSYFWNGNTYTQSGGYTQSGLTNVAGCDSTVYLYLTIRNSTTSYSDLEICPSQLPYSWNGLTFTQGGAQTVILTNAAGCDSLATLTLWIKSVSSSNTQAAVCATALPYSWNGQSYLSAGQYSVILTNVYGCDSTASLELAVLQPTESLSTETVCYNTLPYIWNGQNYFAAGSYSVTLTNAAGCDSTAILQLNVLPASHVMLDTSVCQSDLPFVWNGQSYNSSGMYTAMLTNSFGCDSMVMIMLNVINCDPPCITDDFNNDPVGWTLSQGARFFDYINPANNCGADKGIITPGVGGNNPAFIRTPQYISTGVARLKISFDIFVFDANLKCNSWKNYGCPTSIDVFYISGGVRYPGVIDHVLPPNGPGNNPNVTMEFPVGNNLPAGTSYSIEIAFKFKSGTGGCVQQNTKYVIDNFSVCEKHCANCPSFALYSKAEAGVIPPADRKGSDIKIWPVPTRGMLYFSSSDNIKKVDLVDALGRVVLMACQTNPDRLDLSKLNMGVYFIRLYSQKAVFTRRVSLTK